MASSQCDSNEFDRIRAENANSGPERLRPASAEKKIHTEWLKDNAK